MSAAFTTTIMCDKCGRWDETLTLNGTATRGATASVTRMGCRDAGWECSPDGDFCPECLPATEGDMIVDEPYRVILRNRVDPKWADTVAISLPRETVERWATDEHGIIERPLVEAARVALRRERSLFRRLFDRPDTEGEGT